MNHSADDRFRVTPSFPLARTVWRDGAVTQGPRNVAEEVPVALTYNRATHAVMLATPADLEDFGVGFSLAEGIIGSAGEIESLEVISQPGGIEVRMDLPAPLLEALTRRQRRLTGPSGCGLCGMDSLAAALRPVSAVPAGPRVPAEAIRAAMATLAPAQALNHATHAVHAAGFWTAAGGLVALREDVGRHNALDKLAGALARAGTGASQGLLLLSSRVSVEMVQKAAMMGASIVVAVSAPTALAVRVASQAGITLAGIARADGFELFSHPDRIILAAETHVP